MRLHFLRLSFPGSVLLILFMLTGGTAGAYSGSHSGINPATYRAVPRHSAPVHLKVSALDTSSSGTHYLYVDDGTNPDSIDVYKTGATLTHVGNYPTGGSVSSASFGATNIAVTTGCLVYGDGNDFVDSFPINANGSLGTQVSHLAVGGTPTDIHIKKGTSTAYVNVESSEIASYSIGSGCTLTFDSSVTTSSYFFLNFGIAGKVLLAPDLNTGALVTYTLGTGGSITALNSVAGQISASDSVAVQKLPNGTFHVYTGQAIFGAPQAQGGKLNSSTGAITFLNGSPATDPSGSNGASVTFDKTHHILIQGEQFTSTLANYTVAKGTLAFLNETHMAVSGEEPSDFAQLGPTLFVDMVLNGDVEACTLTSTGATGCKTVATLTTTSGVEAGMALL
ncbi:MAG: lactonase family protein [Ktedonobacteraceae bacterium]